MISHDLIYIIYLSIQIIVSKSALQRKHKYEENNLTDSYELIVLQTNNDNIINKPSIKEAIILDSENYCLRWMKTINFGLFLLKILESLIVF